MAHDTFELTSSLIKGAASKEALAQAHDLKLYRERMLRYSISPLYARYIGETVTIAFNGNFKKFPVNGEEFLISEGHYKRLRKYLLSIDKQIKIAKTNAKFMDRDVTGDFRKL